MEGIFTFSEQVTPFALFSKQHLWALGVLLTVYSLLYLNRGYFKNERVDAWVRYGIAGAFILQEASLSVWRLSIGTWSAATSLPLHLCGILVLVCPVMMITKSYRIYEFAYLLGMSGALQALLTPDIGVYGFPHYRFYQFFFSHGLIIFSVLYMTFVHGFRPVLRSIPKVFITLNLLLPVIGVLNFFTHGNYFFIAGKPETASILDYLGEWPWYILSLEGVALILLFAAYIPFALGNWRAVRRSVGQSKSAL